MHAASATLLSLLAVLWLTRASLDELGAPAQASGPEPQTTGEVVAPAGVSPADQARIEALQRLMPEARAYRDNGLSIGARAQRLGVPEHRLRQLINHHLAFRNFTDFLNRYRLEEAAQRLRDPAQAPLPILTIAPECGYCSLPPFNRAFKARFGMTPSQFRQRAGTA